MIISDKWKRKSHRYPGLRAASSSSRKGIGGQKRKNWKNCLDKYLNTDHEEDLYPCCSSKYKEIEGIFSALQVHFFYPVAISESLIVCYQAFKRSRYGKGRLVQYESNAILTL